MIKQTFLATFRDYDMFRIFGFYGFEDLIRKLKYVYI